MSPTNPNNFREKGQALALVAVAFVIIILFVGLLTDAGILYATYGQLKRAVDSAAVTAATKYRVTGNRTLLASYAEQALELNGVKNATISLYLCDNNGDFNNDDPSTFTATGLGYPPGVDVTAFNAQFSYYCPMGSVASRKYVMVYAQQDTPIYFMRFIGWNSFTLSTSAISEAASLDVVLVMDTSSSMAQTPCNDGTYTVGAPDNFGKVCDTVTTSSTYDLPNSGPQNNGDQTAYAQTCNLEPSVGGNLDSDSDGIKACYPFSEVKNAAKTFIDKLNFPYDRIGIVTFDGEDQSNPGTLFIDGVGDTWSHPFSARVVQGFTTSQTTADSWVDGNLGNGEIPVSFRDQGYTSEYADAGVPWTASQMSPFCGNPASYYGTPNFPTQASIASAVIRYCVDSNVGGGVRVATNLFKLQGSQTSVWVMVFLTDGYTNLSDLPNSSGGTGSNGISSTLFPRGFCQGPHLSAAGDSAFVAPNFPEGWFMVRPLCADNHVLTRFCADDLLGYDIYGHPTCPPQTYGPANGYQMSVTYNTSRYNVEDYARDMADRAALQITCPSVPISPENCVRDSNDLYNQYEPTGEQIVIYAVGLGSGITTTSLNVADDDTTLTPASAMLRYFAAVGDDGDRVTDPCLVTQNTTTTADDVPYPASTNCGNYYFAPNAFQLTKIFEAIAEKIYTRLSQ